MGIFDDILDVLTIGLWDNVLEWLMPDIEQDKQGVKIERQGADKSIPVVYGTQRLGGIKVHKYVTDSPDFKAWNDTLHVIVVFAEGECDAIEELFFNGISENDQQWNGGGLDGKWFKAYKYKGEDGQPASAAAVSGIPNWTIDHRLDGLCYAYIQFQMDEDLSVWRGEPQVEARIRGRKILDTRTGVVAYSENPAMCLRDYLTNDIFGRGLPEQRLSGGSFESVADFCDTAVSNDVTTTSYSIDRTQPGRPVPVSTTTTTTVEKPLFTTNIIIDTEKNSFDNVKELLSTFRGILPPSAGLLKLSLETEGDPEFIFDDDNIDMDEPIDVDSGQINDRANRVEIRFPNKAKEYETDSVFYPDESDPIYQTWLDEDGGKKLDKSLEFTGITSKDEALQMAKVVANKSRFTKSVSFTSEAIGFIVEVGDIVGLTNDTNGWNEKPFRVVEKNLRPDDNVDFKLLEHEDAIYPWSGATYDELEGGTWLGDPSDLAIPSNLTLTPDPTLAKTGVLSWSYVDNAFVRRYEVRVTRSSNSDIVYSTEVTGKSWAVPLLDSGGYTFEVRAKSTTGSVSGWALTSALLAQPNPPNSITLIPSDWEIEVRPQLSGIGLGTQFEFDIVSGDGSGYTPESRARASAYTASGLLPDTLYTVFVRTVNAYGVSAWVSESATTTVTGEQVDPYLNTIRDELDQIELIVDDVEAGPMDINDLLEQVSQDITEVFQRREDVDNEQQKRIQQINELTVSFDGQISATNTRVDEVEVDVNGNASAISGLQLEVNDLESDLSSTIQRVDQVEVDVNGNANAVSALEGQVNDPTNNTSTLYQLVQQAQTDADGNAISISQILSGVTGETGEANALLKLQAYLNDGGLGARAFLGTNVNNQITGVIIDDDGVERVIEFVSDSVRFVDGSGNLKIYYDLNNDRYVFDGEIIAVNSTFSGAVTGSSFVGGNINIGSGNFVVDSNGDLTANSADLVGGLTTSSGTGNRVEIGTNSTYDIWIGSGARNDTNGVLWIKPNGTGFISGEFFEGEIIETKFGSSASTSLSSTATANNHDSAGKDVEVTWSSDFEMVSDTGTSEGGVIEATVEIRRGVTLIKTTKFNTAGVYDPVEDQTTYNGSATGIAVDTGNTSGLLDYSVEVTINPVFPSAVNAKTITVKTFENKLG